MLRPAESPAVPSVSDPLAPADLSFRRLVEVAPNLVWCCRGDGPCDYLNPQWVAYTGRSADELLGYGWMNAIHPEDQQRTIAQWETAVATRSALDIEFRIRRHDGAYRWFAARGVPEFDASGQITRWYGTNTDIQDRRDHEVSLEALHRSVEARVAERTVDLMTTRVQLEMAQHITNTGSWSFDLRTNHVQWSDELFRIFRLPISDVCPQYSEQQPLFHPESWPLLEAAVTRAIAEGVPYEIELQLAPSAEGHRFAIARCDVVRDASGSTIRMFGTFQDVTELVRARRERDTALERIALATSFAGIGIWDWQVDGGTLTWNEQMYRLFDVPFETVPSYDVWRDSVHPEDADAAVHALQLTVDGKSDFLSTYRVPQRDGTLRIIRATAQLRADAGGRNRRVIGICLDVTVEALAERIRDSNLTMLRQFVRYAPAAIAMFDTEVRYIEASQRWAEMYRLPAGSLVGRSHYDVFPEIPERWKQIHREVLAGAVRSHPEDPFVRADGSVQYLAWEARPWYNESGSNGGMLFYTQDVTDAVQLRLRLEQQSRELQRSNDDLQQFAYAASHDLQEPLRAVAGFAQILGRRYAGRLDADADTIIGHMTDGASRMRTLIEDLLMFSRVGSGTTQPTREPLQEIIDAALANLGHAITERGASIEIGPMPVVRVDRALMVQVFQNLIGNSLKYAGTSAPRVHITCTQHPGHFEVVVRDWGIGVPDVAAERVFQIFQRLHTRDEYPGTGVGLSLCRRIVDRHGGTIWLTQPDGPGCAIHFTLPLRSEPHAQP